MHGQIFTQYSGIRSHSMGARTITLTMARTPSKCKKKDNNVVINTHQPNSKKVAAKSYNTTQQPTTPAIHRQAPMAPAHLPLALAVTTMPTTPRHKAPMVLMAPSTQRQMKTMLMPKRQPMAPLMQRQMKMMQMPKRQPMAPSTQTRMTTMLMPK